MFFSLSYFLYGQIQTPPDAIKQQRKHAHVYKNTFKYTNNFTFFYVVSNYKLNLCLQYAVINKTYSSTIYNHSKQQKLYWQSQAMPTPPY